MNRWDAFWTLTKCGYLSSTDKVVFLALLEPSDNDTCALPDRFTPSMEELARWTSLGVSSVKRSVNHLTSHGWLTVIKGRGRGHKSTYRLLPGAPDALCHCVKGPRVTRLKVAKEPTVNPIAETKEPTVDLERVQGGPRKGPNASESPQVKPAFVRREAGKQGQVPMPCDRCPETDTQIVGMFRLCREHAGPRWKATA